MNFALRLIYTRWADPKVIHAVENFCEEIQAVVRENTQEVYWKENNCLQWELSCDCEMIPIETIRDALCKCFSIQPTRLSIYEDGNGVELAYYTTKEEIDESGEAFLVLYIPKTE